METFKLKPLKEKWQSILNQFSWLLLLSSPSGFGTAVRRTTSSLLRAAYKGVKTILVYSHHTLQVNSRLYLSLVFMLVIAPLSNVAYQLFDPSVRIEGWYHSNMFYYLYLMSPWIALAFFSTGLFLLFPSGSKRAYFTVVPITSAFVKILWLHQVTTNEEFHQVIPTYFILPAALIAFIWIFCIDWLLARKYHKYDGHWARLIGMTRAKLDHELIESEIKKLQSFNSKY